MVWKAVSLRQKFRSEMFDGKDAVNEVSRHLVKMLYQDTEEVYFMRKRGELMSAGYAILECLTEAMNLTKKLLENAMAPSNYRRMFLPAFMAWVHFMCLQESF